VIAPERTAHCAAPSARSKTCGSIVPVAVSPHENGFAAVVAATDFSIFVLVGTDFAGAEAFSRAVLAPPAIARNTMVSRNGRTDLQVYRARAKIQAERQREDWMAS